MVACFVGMVALGGHPGRRFRSATSKQRRRAHRARARRRWRTRRCAHRRAESAGTRAHSHSCHRGHQHRGDHRRALCGGLFARGNRGRHRLDRLGRHLPRRHGARGFADAAEGNRPRQPRQPGDRHRRGQTDDPDDPGARTEARAVPAQDVPGQRQSRELRRPADSVSLRRDRHRRGAARRLQPRRPRACDSRQHGSAARSGARSSSSGASLELRPSCMCRSPSAAHGSSRPASATRR